MRCFPLALSLLLVGLLPTLARADREGLTRPSPLTVNFILSAGPAFTMSRELHAERQQGWPLLRLGAELQFTPASRMFLDVGLRYSQIIWPEEPLEPSLWRLDIPISLGYRLVLGLDWVKAILSFAWTVGWTGEMIDSVQGDEITSTWADGVLTGPREGLGIAFPINEGFLLGLMAEASQLYENHSYPTGGHSEIYFQYNISVLILWGPWAGEAETQGVEAP